MSGSDIDGDTLTVTSFIVDSTSYPADSTATIPNVGTINISSSGDYTFTPNINFAGSIPIITYTLSDGSLTSSANLVLTMEQNSAPTAIDDSIPVIEDTPVSGNILANDSDIEGQVLTILGFNVDIDGVNQSFNAGESADIVGIGSLTINLDGDFTFTPAPDYNGPVPIVNYTVSDGIDFSVATLTLGPVSPVNDAPIATDDSNTVPINGSATGNILNSSPVVPPIDPPIDPPASGSLTPKPLSTVTPNIEVIPEQFPLKGFLHTFEPVISNTLDGGLVWAKDYGPDEVVIDPTTGQIRWLVNYSLPSESVYIGIKVYWQGGYQNINVIAHVGVNNIITVGSNGDHPNIKAAMKAMVSGSTVIVEDGVYDGDLNLIGKTLGGSVQQPPSGIATQYSSVIARNPGRAVMTGTAEIKLTLGHEREYLAFKGFYVVNGQVSCYGYGHNRNDDTRRHKFIKFMYCGCDGEEKTSPFTAFRCDDILFESCYALGMGRYKIRSYEGENIVARRCTSRMDVPSFHGEPKGNYAWYSTLNVFAANNLAIDGDAERFCSGGELAGEFTTPTTSNNSSGVCHRSIQLNSEYLFGNMDYQESNGGGDSDFEYHDCVSWDVRPYDRYIMSWGSALFNKMTLGDVAPRVPPMDRAVNSYLDNSRGITNSVIHNISNVTNRFQNLKKESGHVTVGRTVERFGVEGNNITQFEGNDINSHVANTTSHDPFSNGLKYLPRLEKGSLLQQLMKGANVTTHLGRSGTMYGESGFDQETNVPMWPFPLEDIIKEKYSEYSYTGSTYTGHYTNRVQTGTDTLIGKRGFAVDGQNITNYVWEYLGSLAPPFRVAYDGSRLSWAPSPKPIDSYNIYEVSNGRILLGSVAGNVHAVDVVGQEFEVTAVVGSEESGVSYAA